MTIANCIEIRPFPFELLSLLHAVAEIRFNSKEGEGKGG